MTVFRLLALSAACCTLLSCENTQKTSGTGSDPYASNYGNDGHYNPYPGQSGYTTPSTPSYQTPPNYQTPPMPPAAPQPPADPYAFGGSKKPATTSTPSYSKPTPKKTVASSSSAKKKSTSTAKKKSSSSSRYAVSRGDTLYGIARKKGTTVAKIKAANGLSGDVIRPGQSLKIP